MPWFLTLFASKTPMRLQGAASGIPPPFIACLVATSMSCLRPSTPKQHYLQEMTMKLIIAIMKLENSAKDQDF